MGEPTGTEHSTSAKGELARKLKKAGAEARKVMGMTVFSGMLVATLIGVLVVPALYVMVDKYVARNKPGSSAGDESLKSSTENA